MLLPMDVLMGRLNRAPLLYAALLGGVFVLALVSGYVYSHEPERDRLVLATDRSGEPDGVTLLTGSVLEVHSDRLVIERDGAPVEVLIDQGVPVEELSRIDGPFAPGAAVNVGARQTTFGFVLTGIVAVDGAAP